MALSGQIISKIRESKMLTQESLADQVGVSRQTIAMWETGKRLPTDSVVILTARTLELNEGDLMSLIQQERLKSRIERLEDQYGVTIVIANEQEGEMKMGNGKHTAYQTKDGVSLAVTNIYKSIGYEYPEKLMRIRENIGGFETYFEIRPDECLIVDLFAQSENEEFILNGRYFNAFEIVDNIGNNYRQFAGGLRSSEPPEGVGGIVEGVAYFKYVPEARSITLHHKLASKREEDCDFIMFEKVKLDDSGVTKQFGDVTVTYSGVKTLEFGNSPDKQKAQQIQIELHERANTSYVGVHKFTDNLGNEYSIHGWSWTLEEKTREGFLVDNIDPKAESISFKYWISRKILEFELSDLPIPS